MTIYGFTAAEQDLETFYREKASRTLKYLELAGRVFAAEREYLEEATTLRRRGLLKMRGFFPRPRLRAPRPDWPAVSAERDSLCMRIVAITGLALVAYSSHLPLALVGLALCGAGAGLFSPSASTLASSSTTEAVSAGAAATVSAVAGTSAPSPPPRERRCRGRPGG